MKNAQRFAAVLISVAGLPLLAQQVNASGQQNTSVNASQMHASDSSSASASGSTEGKAGVQSSAGANGAADMRSVHGDLQSRLDAKTAKAGDPVVVKTTEKFKTADGAEIPRGTRLIGHVTQVQAHTKGQTQSQLAIVFDRAELKGGESFGIHTVIQSVSPPASASAMAEAGADERTDAMMSGDATMAGGSRAGGGLVNGGRGMADATVGGVSDSAGRFGSGVDAAANGTMSATDRTAANARGMAGASTRGAVGTEGSLVSHATAVPDVMLSGDATGSASGTLTATGKNVALESGTQLVLGIAKD